MKLGMEHVAQHVAYADYRRRLDAQAVLDHYGAENCHEEINGRDGTTEVVHSCLIDRVEPHHANGDATPSARCNLDKKLYTCFTWWSGDLFHLIQKMEGKETLDGIIPVVGEFLGESIIEVGDFKTELQRFFTAATTGAYNVTIPTYNERILAPWAFVHPYLAERGIDSNTASRLHIGWNEKTNRITIPHFWQGHLVGWVSRTIPDRPGQWPGTSDDGPPKKYKNNRGFPKSDTLYGFDLAAGAARIVVVESPFSVIKAEALVVTGVVATFGAKVSDVQIDLLKDFKRVCIWFDDDTAGRVGERRLVNHLYRHTRVSVVRPDPGRDLGDCCTAEQAELKLSEAEPAVFALMRYKQEWGH